MNAQSSTKAEFFAAARSGDVNGIIRGLELGVRVDDSYLSSQDHETALILAAAGGHLGCVKELLSWGANIEATNRWGRTALICACLSGRHDCAEELLKRGANINTQDGFGATALNQAAAHGHLNCIRLLIGQDCKIDFADQDGRTPLMRAAWGSHYDSFVFLLESGAYVPPLGGGLRRQLDGLLGRPENSKLFITFQEHESPVPTTPRSTTTSNLNPSTIPMVPALVPALSNRPLNQGAGTSGTLRRSLGEEVTGIADMSSASSQLVDVQAELRTTLDERETQILQLEAQLVAAMQETFNTEIALVAAAANVEAELRTTLDLC